MSTKLTAGASMIDITPNVPATLGGMFRCYQAEQVLDNLYASSIAICDGNKEIIWISCDLAIITEEMTEMVRARLSCITGVGSACINISATHTHTGPNTGYVEAIFRDGKHLVEDKIIMEGIIEKIIESGVKAHRSMRPAKIGWGKGRAEKCCYNRRYIMADGKSRMAPGNFPQGLMVEGPVDDELYVVWFEDKVDEIIAMMVNYSSHPAVLYSLDCVSADFPGSMRKTIWNALSKKFPVQYLQGACGNTAPISSAEPNNGDMWGLGMGGYRRIGGILAGEVIKLIHQNIATEYEGNVEFISSKIYIPYKDFNEDDINKAINILKEAAGTGDQAKGVRDRLEDVDDWQALKNIKVNVERWAHFYNLAVIKGIQEKYPEYPAEITALKLGGVIFVTNPSELFVEYQIQIKNKFKDKNVIVVELTNGWTSYIPTRQAIALGGYEVMQSRLNEYAGAMITEKSVELIESL